MTIQLELTPEQAHNNILLIDLAVKSNKGGVKVARPAMELVDLIQAAVQHAQKNEPPAASPGQ